MKRLCCTSGLNPPYLFDLSADERERANLGERQSERLTEMRQAWNASMPAIPEDASVSLGYSAKNMPQC